MNIRETHSDGTIKRASATIGNIIVTFNVNAVDERPNYYRVSSVAWSNRLVSCETHSDEVEITIRGQIAAWSAMHAVETSYVPE